MAQKSGRRSIAALTAARGTSNDAVTRVKADQQFQEAQQKLLKRIGKRPGGKVFVDQLPELLVALINLEGKAASDSQRSFWQRVAIKRTGKTPKSLRDFPARLRGMANEVDQVDANLFECVPGLSSHLRTYADRLKLETKKISHAAQFLERRSWRPPKRSDLVLFLSRMTQMFTERPCDREVADLWNAANHVLNPDDDKGLDTRNVADFRKRYKPHQSMVRPRTLLGG